jgi:hypothetical protein
VTGRHRSSWTALPLSAAAINSSAGFHLALIVDLSLNHRCLMAVANNPTAIS